MLKILLALGTFSGAIGATDMVLQILMVYFTGYLLFTLAMAVRRKKIRKDPSYRPSVSILIPAHNESGVIEETVHCMMDQDYDNFELIVVDDASEDGTTEVLHGLRGVYPELKVLRREKYHTRGKPAALNDAMAMAKGEVIAVFDADGRVARDYVSRAIQSMADPRVAGLQTRIRMYNKNQNFWTRAQDSELLIYCRVIQTARNKIGGFCGLGGNGQFVKRSCVEDVGGWPEGTLAEDFDLSIILVEHGHEIVYLDEVSVYQEAVPTFKALIKQRRRWSQGGLQSTLRHFWGVVRSRRMRVSTKIDLLYLFSHPLQVVVLGASYAMTFYGFTARKVLVLKWHWGWYTGLYLAFTGAYIVFIVAAHLMSRHEKLSVLVRAMVVYYLYSLFWCFLYAYSVGHYIMNRGKVSWGKTVHGVSRTLSRMDGKNLGA